MPAARVLGASIAAGALAVAVQFGGGGYEENTAQWKREFLWTNVQMDTHGGSFMNPLATLYWVVQKSYLWAMTNTHADVRQGHKKATHGIGGHAKGHFEWKTNEYTGMFQQADHCIIRMANAAEPGTLAMTAYGPNLAVKCLRDGVESANMQFIWQLDGYAVIPPNLQRSCSYFEAPLCNHNPVRDDIMMALKDTFIGAFDRVDQRSMLLGVSQMATRSQNGSEVAAPNFPFALVLSPAPGLNRVHCDFEKVTSQLLNLEAAGLASPGQVLYDVYAVKDPAPRGPDASSLAHIGALVLDTPFTNSAFGDTELFFRHTFWHQELSGLSALDAPRAEKWYAYVNNEENYKKEGASLYWPFLPSTEETAVV